MITEPNQPENDEYLDLVDENDQIIDRKLRSQVHNERIKNVRVVNAFLVNSKGELWIPRRVSSKRSFPLHLDMSVGGYVMSGETYEEAIKREIKEEVNLDFDNTEHRFLGYLSAKDGISCFMKVYEIKMDETPDYNKNDFCEYFWIRPEELIKRIENGEKAKDDLPKLVRRFYLK